MICPECTIISLQSQVVPIPTSGNGYYYDVNGVLQQSEVSKILYICSNQHIWFDVKDLNLP